MHSLIVAAADLLLGASCAGCAAPALTLCPPCRLALADGEPRLVARPGLDLSVVAAGNYRPVLEHVVPRFKDDGALHLTGLLADRLALAVALLVPEGRTVLVPVPSLPSAVRRRGFDHTRALASATARRTRLRWAPLLRRRPQGRDQRVLGRTARRANVAGGMVGRPGPASVLLIDDVITTGASLAEAVRALRAVGVEVVGAAVAGEADRRRPRDVALPPGASRDE